VARKNLFKNNIFLCITFILMQPQRIAEWIGLPHEQRYWCYLIGLAIFGALYMFQKMRGPEAARPLNAVA
jgi:hypothetical protein